MKTSIYRYDNGMRIHFVLSDHTVTMGYDGNNEGDATHEEWDMAIQLWDALHDFTPSRQTMSDYHYDYDNGKAVITLFNGIQGHNLPCEIHSFTDIVTSRSIITFDDKTVHCDNGIYPIETSCYLSLNDSDYRDAGCVYYEGIVWLHHLTDGAYHGQKIMLENYLEYHDHDEMVLAAYLDHHPESIHVMYPEISIETIVKMEPYLDDVAHAYVSEVLEGKGDIQKYLLQYPSIISYAKHDIMEEMELIC